MKNNFNEVLIDIVNDKTLRQKITINLATSEIYGTNFFDCTLYVTMERN